MTTTILLADDDAMLLEALSIRLQAEGYRVITLTDGYQALQQSIQLQPDLLVLDVNMPAGDGFSVLTRAARVGNVLSDVPVIFMTGEDSPRVDHAVRDHGAFAVLRKPFAYEALSETIAAALAYGPAHSAA